MKLFNFDRQNEVKFSDWKSPDITKIPSIYEWLLRQHKIQQNLNLNARSVKVAQNSSSEMQEENAKKIHDDYNFQETMAHISNLEQFLSDTSHDKHDLILRYV